MDASPFVRRTPAGDAELRTPATGLSVTQRRILTLLDNPERLRNLALRPMVNTAWLTRDAAHLQKTGLIVFDVADGGPPVAANAESPVQAPARPLARPLPLFGATVAAVVLVWSGWHFSAAPTPERTRTGVPSAVPRAATSPMSPSLAAPEPPVIATRVLRGDTVTKDARAGIVKPGATPAQIDALRPSSTDAPHPVVVEPRVPRTELLDASRANGPQSAREAKPDMAEIDTASRADSTPRSERGVGGDAAAPPSSDSVSVEGER